MKQIKAMNTTSRKKRAETAADLLYHTRSKEVQEVMGRMPSWIIRWGIMLMCLLILGFFIGAAFIKYPDTVKVKAVIVREGTALSHNAGASLTVPASLRNRIKEGQVLMVSAEGFPSSEFGLLEGRIAAISALSEDGYYTADVSLTHGLVSTNAYTIPCNGRLKATADILLDDKSLLERLLNRQLPL